MSKYSQFRYYVPILGSSRLFMGGCNVLKIGSFKSKIVKKFPNSGRAYVFQSNIML